MRYFLIFLTSISCLAQGFGNYTDLPFLAGPKSTVVGGEIIRYDATAGVETKTGPLVNNDFVIGWTNTAPGGSHLFDLLLLTNLSTSGGTTGTTNPIYRTTWSSTNGPVIDFSQTTNANNISSIANQLITNIAQPFVTFIFFRATNTSSASPPFNHALWSSTGDNDIGDQGLADIGSPPWQTKTKSNGATPIQGPALAGGVWYLITTVWNGANSYIRTNKVDYVSGNIGVGAFGANSKGFDFCQSTGFTPYYIRWWSLYNRLLSTNEISTVENMIPP